ncbi:MFS general substrate transporter [Rhizodiscina lignyota]|uniref:MFS general substrate transporter n=1 Tax=Rhizodiscina lignyota TaxID=1504668 RepID=A0A9P4IGB4_9PEZI|nr:MFS general substrate transporter [Rhizodiscina lignyota]
MDSKSDPEQVSVTAAHSEFTPGHEKWLVSRTGDGDAAMALFASPAELSEPIDPEEERKLVWKIDLGILPYLTVCYAFFYIDKTTLSYAALFGLQEDLHLHGTQYSWLSSIFYFGFLAWALPTNLLLQRMPVAKYLGVNIFLWGVFLMLQAVSRNFTDLAVLRAISGAAESCSDPAFMIITSMWYTRRQQPVRMGLWYTANGLGTAFGGLLGYGIGHIGGSLASWRYEFLIIGALCCIWGVVMFIFLPDNPVTAPRLTDRERRIAIERIKGNQTGVENKHFKWYQLREALTDPKTFILFFLGIVATIPNGGITNFGTLIIKGFGFSTLVTTLLQVPYGFLTTFCILGCVYLNDWLAERLQRNTRCLMIVLFVLPNVCGAFMLRFVPSHLHVARLWGYYLTGPYNAAFVLILSLATANTAGHTKKVVTNAILFLGYCTGNLAGPFFYKSSQAPTYNLGIWSMIVSHLLQITTALVLRTLLSWENHRRDKAQAEAGVQQNLDETAFADMTDRENPNFRK